MRAPGQGRDDIVRRSAGLPFAFVALFLAEPVGSHKVSISIISTNTCRTLIAVLVLLLHTVVSPQGGLVSALLSPAGLLGPQEADSCARHR